MTPNQLKAGIIKNQYPNILIFTGPETYVKTFYLNKISNNWVRENDIKNISFNVKSLFPLYYLIDGESLNSQKDADLEKLKDKLLVTGKNKYVFVYNNGEKLSKNVETIFSNYIVKFNALNQNHLLAEFSSYGLSPEEAIELFDFCNNDYLKIQNELKKIEAYTKELNISPSIAYTMLKNQDIIIKPIGDIIFNFTGAIMSGNITQANYWLEKIKQTDEPFLVILTTLYKNFKTLYLVKASEGNKQVRANIGLEQNRIWAISKNLKIYSELEIRRNLNIIQTIEEKFKLGQISEESALNYLVVNLLV